MNPVLKQVEEKPSKHRWRAHELSVKILSWGVLLEQRSRWDEFAGLEGLGISLQSYSRQLKKIVRSLDEIEVELASVTENGSQEGVRK
jgi:hypothetical protein